MAFTYDIDTDAGKVRFATGDTEATRALLSDAEIAYLLSLHLTVSATVVPALTAMIDRASHGVSYASGGESVQLSNRLKQLRTLRADKISAGYPDTSGGSTSRVLTFRRDDGDNATEYSS